MLVLNFCYFAPQPTKDVNVEKSFKVEEEDVAKPKLPETKKVTSQHYTTDTDTSY